MTISFSAVRPCNQGGSCALASWLLAKAYSPSFAD